MDGWKGAGRIDGVLFCGESKMAAVACKVTKPEPASTGSKPFAIKNLLSVRPNLNSRRSKQDDLSV